MLLRRATRSLQLSTVALLLPVIAGAQGYALNEIGSCAVGRSFAVTAGGCNDASSIFWNPAGTLRNDGWSALAGAATISLKGSFKRDTTGREYDADASTAIVPHVFVNHHMKGSRWAFGAGLYVPYGLTSQWDTTFPGRFESQKASLKTFYVQPNVAYQINKDWSIGGGPIWAHSSVELDQSLDLSQQIAAAATATTPAVTFAQLGIAAGTEFGRGHLTGSASGFGGQLGVMGRLNSSWTVGARYLFPITFNYDNGDVSFTQVNTGLVIPATLNASLPAGTKMDTVLAKEFATGGPLAAQKASTKIKHPAQAQIGANYSGFKGWNLEADYQWTQWSSFDSLVVTFPSNPSLNQTKLEQYNNSSSLRLSAEHAFQNQALLRLGISGVTSAAPDYTVTPLLPEQERAYYTIGGGYPINGNFSLDGAFAYISTLGRRGRTGGRSSTTLGASQVNNGVYSLSAYIFSLSLKASF
jgi:long-chain fatty acid transport protein